MIGSRSLVTGMVRCEAQTAAASRISTLIHVSSSSLVCRSRWLNSSHFHQPRHASCLYCTTSTTRTVNDRFFSVVHRHRHSKKSASQQYKRGKATIGRTEALDSAPAGATKDNVTARTSSWIDSLTEFFRRQRTIAFPRWVTPVHQTISISEVFGHASFVLVAISYAVDDFLLLRCIAVVGSTSMLVFTYFQ